MTDRYVIYDDAAGKWVGDDANGHTERFQEALTVSRNHALAACRNALQNWRPGDKFQFLPVRLADLLEMTGRGELGPRDDDGAPASGDLADRENNRLYWESPSKPLAPLYPPGAGPNPGYHDTGGPVADVMRKLVPRR